MSSKDTIEAAIAMAEAETGASTSSKLRVCIESGSRKTARRWTKEEDDFIIKNIGKMSDKEMGKHLKRTATAVHIRRERDLHLQSPSKNDQVLTGEHIAIGLGVDGKSVHALIDRGIMPGRRLPTRRVIRVVDRHVLLRWLLDVENWPYFKPERVGELRKRGKRSFLESYDFAYWDEVRRLIIKKRNEWDDEWLTPGEAAKILKLKGGTRPINKAIHVGNIKATRWQNWNIKLSEIARPGMRLNAAGEWREVK